MEDMAGEYSVGGGSRAGRRTRSVIGVGELVLRPTESFRCSPLKRTGHVPLRLPRQPRAGFAMAQLRG